MKSYRDLQIYQLSKILAIEIHVMSLDLPRFEMYEEGSQIRRSSKAVTSAIVEGYGRKNYKADFLRYLTIAHTECDETLLHLEFLFETKSLKNEGLFQDLSSRYVALSKAINRFISWAQASWLT